MSSYYANVIDLTNLGSVARAMVGDWIEDHDIRSLEPGRIDGDYVRIGWETEPDQARARAEILSERFDVRVKSRA